MPPAPRKDFGQMLSQTYSHGQSMLSPKNSFQFTAGASGEMLAVSSPSVKTQLMGK